MNTTRTTAVASAPKTLKKVVIGASVADASPSVSHRRPDPNLELSRQTQMERQATDVPELLEQPDVLPCQGCGDAMTDTHLYDIINDLEVKRDYLRRPLGPFDKESPTPVRLSTFVYCTPGCLLRHSKNSPFMPAEKEQHYIVLLFAWRYNIVQVVSPLPPIECMQRYQISGAGLSSEQRIAFLRFPHVLAFYQRYPMRRPPFPNEGNAVCDGDRSLLSYYRIQELPVPIQKAILSGGSTPSEAKGSKSSATSDGEEDVVDLIGLDSDPDSDDDVSLHATHKADEELTFALIRRAREAFKGNASKSVPVEENEEEEEKSAVQPPQVSGGTTRESAVKRKRTSNDDVVVTRPTKRQTVKTTATVASRTPPTKSMRTLTTLPARGNGSVTTRKLVVPLRKSPKK